MPFINPKSLIFFMLFFESVIVFGQEGLDREAYASKSGKLNVLKMRVKETEKTIKKLVQRKAAAATREQEHQIMEEMVRVHEGYKKDTREYNALRNELKYRFPEKDDETERQYQVIKDKTLDDIEEEIDLDGALTQFKKKMDKKYEPFVKAAEEKRFRELSSKMEKEKDKDEAKYKPKGLVLEK